jgi:mandelamide amidase
VKRLRDAGALVMGKTNLHELSFGWTSANAAFGPVRNPHDPQRIPGGSSGGTAAAVAAGMAPLGVAEDTAGSIRVPAALCGLLGFRPTTGRYPTDGVVPMSALFDQIGPHARCMADVALFDAVMTGDHRPIAPADLAGVRLGIARDFHCAGLDAEVADAFAATVARLEAAGVTVLDVALPGVQDLIDASCVPIIFHDLLPALADYLAASDAPASLASLQAAIASPDVQGAFSLCVPPGASPDMAAARAQAVGQRQALQQFLAGCLAKHRIDALIFPTTLVAAPLIGADHMLRINGEDVPFATAIGRNIMAGSTAGLPGLVMPNGLGHASGLPMSIELDGPAGGDRALLAIGLAIAALLPPPLAPSFPVR